MIETPLISVVMPVWNARSYLALAVESILSQTFTNFELIAIDDGSTDGSDKLLVELAARDGRVRMITQQNAGVTSALNTGLAAVRGTYVARMDADDIARPKRFDRQIAYMEADPSTVVLGGQFVLIDPDGRPLRQLSLPLDHEAIDKRHLGGADMGICHPTAMIRRDALEKVGGYNTALPVAQDFDLWLRLAEVGQLANLNEIVLDYRQHSMSLGYLKRQLQEECARSAAAAAIARRGLRVPEVSIRRPERKVERRNDILRRWGWWALSGGNIATARHYAALALLNNPLSLENWRLGYCALRGR